MACPICPPTSLKGQVGVTTSISSATVIGRARKARIPHDEPVSIASTGLDSGYHCPDDTRLRGFLAARSGHVSLYPLRRTFEGLQTGCEPGRGWHVCRL